MGCKNGGTEKGQLIKAGDEWVLSLDLSAARFCVPFLAGELVARRSVH